MEFITIIMLSQLEDKLFIIRNKRYWLMETKEIVE